MRLEQEGELAVGLRAVERKHVEAGHGFVALAEPVVTGDRKCAALGAWTRDTRARELREATGVAHVIRVRDDDEARAAEGAQVSLVMSG